MSSLFTAPVRQASDLVSRVTFKGRKTGKILVRWHTARTEDTTLAENLALQHWQLSTDINRLVEIKCKRRDEWLRDGEDVGEPGTMIGA